LRIAPLHPLFASAWRYRHNITFADAKYVALAEHLSAQLLTDDHKLANVPALPVPVLRLGIQS
jgi:predicted nucleic acid-binding protein